MPAMQLEEIDATNALAGRVGSSPNVEPVLGETTTPDPVTDADVQIQQAAAEKAAQEAAEAQLDAMERLQKQQLNTATTGHYDLPDMGDDAPDRPSEDEWNDMSSRGASGIVNIAKKYLGTPYVWGAESPTGVDCSGFIYAVYKEMGMTLPRVSYQMGFGGKAVDEKNLKVGDLLFWDSSSRNNGADHVAMYIGNGKMIEAQNPRFAGKVLITNVRYSGMWARRYLGASHSNQHAADRANVARHLGK